MLVSSGMLVGRHVVAAALLPFLSLLVGCGFEGYPYQAITTPAVTLEGNWLIFGSLPQLNSANPGQGLALSLTADGNTIVGAASLAGRCASGESFVIVFDNAISAVPDATGRFVTSSTQAFGWGFTLTGTAPNAAGRPWSGTYQLTNDGSNTFCPFSGSGNFTATPVGQMDGTFTGSGTATSTSGNGAAVDVGITTALTQGATAPNAAGHPAYDAQLLSGTLDITGISCFSHGSASASIESSVLGNEFLADFSMDDGSVLNAVGTIDNTTTTQVLLNNFSVVGGACAGNYVFATPGAQLVR